MRGDSFGVRPVGFGNAGTWAPSRLNECFKLTRYAAGARFAPHLDGPWVPREDESSVYTLVAYLNDGFGGGETRFLQEPARDAVVEGKDAGIESKEGKKGKEGKAAAGSELGAAMGGVAFEPCHTVAPRAGSALVFNHDTLHEGLPVAPGGTKYLLRTEIMPVAVPRNTWLQRKRCVAQLRPGCSLPLSAPRSHDRYGGPQPPVDVLRNT